MGEEAGRRREASDLVYVVRFGAKHMASQALFVEHQGDWLYSSSPPIFILSPIKSLKIRSVFRVAGRGRLINT